MEPTISEPWLPLARFISQLPALKDVIWAFRNMPRPILMAIHAVGTCRLHIYRFHLYSLVVHRTGHPQVVDIDPDDYALATLPALYSVTMEVRYYKTDGQLNYHEEARRPTFGASG